MKIIDYLIQINSGTIVNCGNFTVDIAEDYVELVYPAGAAFDRSLVDASGGNNGAFRDFDNFLLISLGIILPAPFEIHGNGARVNLSYADNEAGAVPLPGCGGLNIPFANYEVPIGIMYRPSDLEMITWNVDDDVTAGIGGLISDLDGTAFKISMANIPAVFDGRVVNVPLFAKVLHNSSCTTSRA